MPDYQISANLNAQINGFRQGMNEATRASNTAANSIDNNMERIDRASARTGRSVEASARQIRQSGNRYLEFGRVLQDLPFGFQGIQNNLTQIIPAAGAAGLAFSAIVSALTFLQVGTGAWTRGMKENKTALDDSKKSGDDYIKTLSGIAQAQLKGSQDAQEELTKLKSLYRITTDVSISMKQRSDAVNELQKQYPEYFKNMTDEAIMAGRAKSAYDLLAQSILATARARAAESKITANAIRQLEDESKINNLRIEQQKALAAERKQAELSAFIASQGTTGPGSGNIVNEKKLHDLRANRLNLDKQITDLATDHNKLTAENLRLEKEITKQVKAGADLADFTPPASRAARLDRGFQLEEIKGQKDFLDPTFAFRQAEGFRQLLRNLTAYQAGIQGIEQTLTAAQTRMLENAISFNEQFSAITNEGFKSAVSGIAEAMGSALAEGGNVFQAIGQSLLQSLGGVLIQLGEMAIGIGVGLTAIKTALESLNPVLAIGAGIALVALGSFFKGKAANIGGNIKGGSGSNITAFANGGIVSGPTNALIGEYSGAKNNPEVVAPLNKLKGMLGNSFAPVLIPIVNSKQLAILVRDGNDKLNRQ